MEQQYLTIWDLVLTPLYLVVLILIAMLYRNKHYPEGHPLRKYYLPGLYAKFGGAIFIALIYAFYYGGGDTFNFFYHSKIINSALDDSFGTWLDLLMHKSPDVNPVLYKYTSQLYWYNDTASYTVARVAAVLGLLNGTTYLPTALLFAYISFTGVWALYKTFARLYPRLHKPLALAFLFIPSVVVWGSAIFKDTLCLFGLGWMVYCTFRVIVQKDFSVKNLLLLAVSFYIIGLVKVYILLAFLPALWLWLLMNYSHKIGNVGLRWLVNLGFAGVVAAGFLFFSNRFADELNRYSLDQVVQTAEATRDWIAYASGDEGSAYNLGEFAPTAAGMLSKFPAAIVVTLFRPFPWEARKLIVIFSALESLLFLGGTILVVYRAGLSNILKVFDKDANLVFFLVFSLIFAFAVGISSYNFGALSRYKVPCLPFYGALLVILYNLKSFSSVKTNATQFFSGRSKLIQD